MGSLPPSKPPPARHRPGARSARRLRCRSHVEQTASNHEEMTMLFRPLLERLTPRRNSRPAPRAKLPPKSCRLAVESLEDRWTPAGFFYISDASVVEGNTGALNALVTVTLTGQHGNKITVDYQTTG